MIWGFSAGGLAANTARDLGGRFAAMTIWGTAGASLSLDALFIQVSHYLQPPARLATLPSLP